LFAAAAAGRLSTPDEIERQARRLLKSPEAGEAIRDFHRQWLSFDRLPEASKDPVAFPGFTPELAQLMLRQTEDFVTSLFQGQAGDGKLESLFTSNLVFVDDRLARIYGLADVPAGGAVVRLDPRERAGILTQAAFLTAAASPDDSSI